VANDLGYYNPVFYAQEALILLERALGLAGRVHIGYDAERRAFGRGEYINIRKPSTFSVADAPDTTGQDLNTDTLQVQLAYWREVKFKLTDKELAFTGERIIQEHIRPAAYALADDIDTKLAALYADIPWYYDTSGSASIGNFTGPWKVLFDNAVPMTDLHMMLNGTETENALQLSAFTQWQGAGDEGVAAQRRGTLGTKFGFEVFSNQNVQSHTKGTLADGGSDAALQGAHSKGATSVTIDATSLTGTFKKGDVLTISGSTQQYAATADATAAANAITISITPALVQDYSDNAAITWRLDSHTANLGFHRNAFALVTAPLSELGSQLGAKVASVQDPKTGLSLRSRLYYVGKSSEVHVALDVLYGVKTLDPNLAVRICGA
jgi:hypothetical protein